MATRTRHIPAKIAMDWIAANPEAALNLAQQALENRARQAQPQAPAIASPARPVQAPSPVTGNPARQVLDAFKRLDANGHNQVAMCDLLDETGLSVESLHAAVMHLWRAGTISMAAIEGRHGVTPRELKAALRLNGEVLGFVMMRVN